MRSALCWCLAASLGALLACGEPPPSDRPHTRVPGPTGVDCPDGSTLTYETFGRELFGSYCTTCHDSAKTGGDRNAAPLGIDFDTLTGIREHAHDIDRFAGAGPTRINVVMPPSTHPAPSDAERDLLAEWLACGAPP